MNIIQQVCTGQQHVINVSDAHISYLISLAFQYTPDFTVVLLVRYPTILFALRNISLCALSDVFLRAFFRTPQALASLASEFQNLHRQRQQNGTFPPELHATRGTEGTCTEGVGRVGNKNQQEVCVGTIPAQSVAQAAPIQ